MSLFKKIIDSNKRGHFIFLFIGVVAGVIGSYFVGLKFTESNNQPVEVRAGFEKYSYINPLLFYKNSADTDLDSLKDKLSSYVKNEKSKGNAKEISVYYRDMNSGHWTGVNEEATYVPASMLKVVYMISYLKRAEDDPSVFQKKLYYKASDRDQATFDKANNNLPSGYYTVNNLINYMIVYSDNAALMALAFDDGGRVDTVLNLFQLPTRSTSSSSPDYMSARTFSRIFRVLYDGNFLSWNLSEQALKILSLTKYRDGLQAGIPSSVVVSHKFGERTNVDQYGKVVDRELHDCGIVYKTNKPYFLCVMTKGDDFLKLQNIIEGISDLVYGEI